MIYRDFWDLKQPLVFYLYFLAGRLAGFTESGIHLSEALYQTVFAGVLIALSAKHLRPRWAASLVPLFTIGVYEGIASNYALTSVEALAGFPIFVAAAFAADAAAGARHSGLKIVAAGVAGGLAVGFKFVFAPLLAVLWLIVLVARLRANGPARTIRLAAGLVLGALVPIGAGVAYFASTGTLDVALRTAFVDPPQILHHLSSADRSPFWPEVRAFARMIWPLAVLAAVGVVSLRRRPDLLLLQMLGWFCAGCAIISLQVWSYDYRFYVIMVPVGILAVRGLTELVAFARERGRYAHVALAAVLCVLLAASAHSVARVHARWSDWARDNQRSAASSLTLLDRPDARPGAIYVFGDPRAYYYSRRDQAVPINGWSPQLLLPNQWRQLRAELAAAAPPYIMVENDYVPRVRRSPEMVAYLERAYRPAFASRDAMWYERRDIR